MSERLTVETTQFSQIFTPDIDCGKKFYFSPINCAVSSVSRSIRSFLIKCRAQLYVTQPMLCRNEARKNMPFYPLSKVTEICRNCGSNSVPPSVQIIVQFLYLQFCAQVNFSVKLTRACMDHFKIINYNY